MFANCSSLQYLNVSNFDTTSSKTTLEMLSGINQNAEIVGLEFFEGVL